MPNAPSFLNQQQPTLQLKRVFPRFRDSMIQDEPTLSKSDLWSIRNTPHTGRAVFAEKKITGGTQLLVTPTESSPLAHVILKIYRREVCAQCFAYDRGREWKTRYPTAGVCFCSDSCQTQWLAANHGLPLEAYEAVASIVKKNQQRVNKIADCNTVHLETHASGSAVKEDSQTNYRSAWEEAAILGDSITQARLQCRPSKAETRTVKRATELTPDHDVLSYLLSGVLAAYDLTKSNPKQVLGEASTFEDPTNLLPSLYQLESNPLVYNSTSTVPCSLKDYVDAYHLLLAVLPTPLLRYVHPQLCHELASRASHNAFAIRPTGTTDGEHSGEFLGWGVWPEASFFNHSCRPNIRKERKGRLWNFLVEDNQSIDEGEELCITYLGGDEEDLDVKGRRKRLNDEWGFWCCCTKCVTENDEN